MKVLPSYFGRCVEWHVDLRKPNGEIDMGKAGLSWDDGTWHRAHPPFREAPEPPERGLS
jgi:hypothetical protein